MVCSHTQPVRQLVTACIWFGLAYQSINNIFLSHRSTFSHGFISQSSRNKRATVSNTGAREVMTTQDTRLVLPVSDEEHDALYFQKSEPAI